jgi:hypothetical protein
MTQLNAEHALSIATLIVLEVIQPFINSGKTTLFGEPFSQ